jgi:hypothetical protein
MSNITTRYRAKSLEDLADGIEALAANKKQQSETATKVRTKHELKAEARGLSHAADIVRNTTIDPEME